MQGKEGAFYNTLRICREKSKRVHFALCSGIKPMYAFASSYILIVPHIYAGKSQRGFMCSGIKPMYAVEGSYILIVPHIYATVGMPKKL